MQPLQNIPQVQNTIGNNLDNIEKQQCEIMALINEIDFRLSGFSRDSITETECHSEGYAEMIFRIANKNTGIINTLQQISNKL